MQDRELGWEAALRGATPDEVRQLWIADTPLGRLESPEDVARVVAFLAGPDAAVHHWRGARRQRRRLHGLTPRSLAPRVRSPHGHRRSQAPRRRPAEADLAQFGYTQQLHRAIGGYTSFALAFSMISVTTTVFTLFAQPFQSLGGVAIWLWLPVGGGVC